MAVPQDKSNQIDTFVTGSADGDIKVWRDNTAEKEEEELQLREERFLKEQDFYQALQHGDYKKALRLALELGKPYNFRILVEKIMKLEPDTFETSLQQLLSGLTADDLGKLLGYVREWNLISRTCVPAQVVLQVVLKSYSFDMLATVKGIEEYVDALLAYNKRHMEVGS